MINIDYIESILNYFNVNNYNINKDGSVDVYDSVHISLKNIHRLEIQFNHVHGDFVISNNPLTTLKGLPRYIDGSLFCRNTSLETLEHFPEFINGYSYLIYNPIKTLNGYNGSFSKLYCDNKDKLVRKYKLNNIIRNI